MNYLNFERFAWKTGSSRRKRWRWTSGYSWTEGRSRRKRLIKIRKLRKCALFYENFNNLGDIGGRCSECSPGYKGDKGERGYDGIPGPIGKRSHSIRTKLCLWFMAMLVFFLKSGKKLWIVLYWKKCWLLVRNSNYNLRKKFFHAENFVKLGANLGKNSTSNKILSFVCEISANSQ